MKAILVGVGEFGSYWYRKLKDYYKQINVIVVDKEETTAKRILDDGDKYYLSFEEAVSNESPDFVINVTPPSVHNIINNLAFDFRLPVLCEKPMSHNYEEALKIVERAQKENLTLIYGENYRFDPHMRKIRSLIERNEIGSVGAICVDFYRDFHTQKEYFNKLQNPILEDVAIHHLDLMRFLTGSEIKGIYAKCYNPVWSWTNGNMNLDMILYTENGVSINYRGSMVCRGKETPWLGNWRIEGSEGIIAFSDNIIKVLKAGTETIISDIPRSYDILDEFLEVLHHSKESGVSGSNYIHTQALVYLAAQASKQGKYLNVIKEI